MNEWIKNVVHIYSVILLKHKRKEIGSFVVMWMNPQSVISSKVTQKEKNKYHISMDIFRIWKNGTDELICTAGIEIQIQRMDLWTQKGKRRVG